MTAKPDKDHTEHDQIVALEKQLAALREAARAVVIEFWNSDKWGEIVPKVNELEKVLEEMEAGDE